MSRYLARVITRNGVELLELQASERSQAERLAARKGTVLDVRKRRGFDLSPGMNAADRYTFMVRLSTMLGSKVGTAESLRLLSQNFGGTIRKAAKSMLTRVESGYDLPTAMEFDRKNFPATLTALVKAGGAGGQTWRALKDAADFEYKLSQLRKSSNKGIWSALISFLIAGVLMVTTTQIFGPWVLDNPMFAGSADVQVKWVETAGNILTVVMAVMLAVLGGFVWMATIGRQLFPNFFDQIIVKIPYYRELVLAQNNYVTLYKLGLLVRSGVRIEESLQLTWEGCPRGALRTDLQNALTAVRGGRSWGATMVTLHSTDRAALSASADRDDVARTLDVLATQYRDIYVQRISSFSPALQLVAALFMSLASGVLFGETVLPMLQLSAGIAAGH
ncbi:general secretion pathway protein F [Bradyrhizobium sp. USDA 4341]